MYSLTIHFGPNAMVWAFMFKDKKNADFAYSLASNPPGQHMTVEDDFGQQASFKVSDVHGMMLEDLDLVEEARILRSLANARGEVKARQRASTDPVLRAAQQGPSVLTPSFGR